MVDKDLMDAKNQELKCQLPVEIFQLEVAPSFAGNPPSGVLFNSTISSNPDENCLYLADKSSRGNCLTVNLTIKIRL